MDPYQKVVSPSMPQRQSGTFFNSSQVGLPRTCCQVGNSRVYSDNEIAVGHDGGGFHKVPCLVDVLLTVNKAVPERAIHQLLRSGALLQRQETGSSHLGDGGKCLQGEGAARQVTVFPLVGCLAS